MIAENKSRYAGIVVLILLGSFYFTTATGIAGSMERMVVQFGSANLQEDATFTTDQPLTKPTGLEDGTGAVIEQQVSRDVPVQGGELRLLGRGEQVNVPAVTSGRGLQGPMEILLDPGFMRDHGYRLGGAITVAGRDFTVVGTAAVPNYVYILKNFYDVLPTAGFGVGVVSPADLASLPGAVGNPVSTYSVRLADRNDVAGQLRDIRERVVSGGDSLVEWTASQDNPRIHMPYGNITSMQSMSFPVAAAFFLLGSVIVGVMVMRTVKSDSVAIGTLYALGYRRRELALHYLALPTLVAAIGSVLGTLLALPAARPVVTSMLSAYNLPDTGIAFSFSNLAIAVLAPVLLTAAAAFLVIRRVLRTRAVDLMKGDEQSAKVNRIESLVRLDRFRFATRFRIREQLRSIPRLLFLVLGVAAASVVMLFGLTFSSSMDTLTEQGSVTRYEYPIEYNFTRMQNLQQNPLPPGAEPYHTIRVHPQGRESVEFYLTGLEPGSVGMRLADTQGSPLPRDQVNITAPLADRLDVRVGDSLTVVSQLDGAPYTVRIDGIIQAYGEQFITMPLDGLNAMTGDPAGSYRTVLADHELDVRPDLLAGVLDTRDPSAFDDISAPTSLIVTSVTALAVLIAVVILFLVTSLIIDENRQNISLLKVLGYRSREIASLVLSSSTPAVVLGFALGVPLTVGFATVLYAVVADAVNMVIPLVISPWDVVISLVVILAVYQATKWMSARRVAQIPMNEALKAGAE
ncbi:hypothetical protein WY02_00270 [Pseudonocardia sp. AL041005-10]|nr:FtsX-like permease family protein [Pseudonocardia sp. AL041005-10]ALE77186.1 hypothetical protein WY02_00270 [Pseudonocardia sp. AL041005-10]